MDYYKKRKLATLRIKRLMQSEIPLKKIVLMIQEEYGLSEKFVGKTYNLFIKDSLGELMD